MVTVSHVSTALPALQCHPVQSSTATRKHRIGASTEWTLPCLLTMTSSSESKVVSLCGGDLHLAMFDLGMIAFSREKRGKQQGKQKKLAEEDRMHKGGNTPEVCAFNLRMLYSNQLFVSAVESYSLNSVYLQDGCPILLDKRAGSSTITCQSMYTGLVDYSSKVQAMTLPRWKSLLSYAFYSSMSKASLSESISTKPPSAKVGLPARQGGRDKHRKRGRTALPPSLTHLRICLLCIRVGCGKTKHQYERHDYAG